MPELRRHRRRLTRRQSICLLLAVWTLPWFAAAADFERARALKDRFRDKVAGLRVHATWSEDGDELVYSLRPSLGGGTESWRVDPATGERRVVDAPRAGDAPVERTLTWLAPEACRSQNGSGEETQVRFVNQTEHTLRLFWVTAGGERRGYGHVDPGKTRSQHTYAGHAWLLTDTNDLPIAGLIARPDPGDAVITEELRREPPRPGNESKEDPPSRFLSPDGRWRVVFKQHNAWLAASEGGAPVALTDDGTGEDGYCAPVHWSPDGRWVVITRREEAKKRMLKMVESSPEDQIQPRLISHPYRKPGDDIPQDRPVLLRVSDRARVDVDASLFPRPWALRNFHWAHDSSEIYFEYNERGHQVYRVLAVDPTNGRIRTVIEEQSETFIDYANKVEGRHLEVSNQLLWMSERDGWNHLYVVDRGSGDVVCRLTRGAWVVRGIDRVDEDAGQVWFRVMGLDPDQDPYHVHYARVNLDGTGFTRLTEGNGTHALEFSPDGRFYIDTWSRVDQPPVHELRRAADGMLVCELGRADDAALRQAGWMPPEPFAAKGRDGETDIWGVIYRPTDMDPALSYPVIEQIYAGPQGHHVPKRFAAYRHAQALAELGFVVVQIDGMGTNWRGKRFHDVAWKNLKDAGFPDRIAWMKAAADRYPYLDLSRVGIYGGSAGGQNAMRAVLDHHDFYRAAAADCGCHDNRMDKIWWNEAWMGWPVDDSYAKSSNVVDAHKLGGALLLTVGELDRNVDPASTMQVVNALIKADKDFELVIFPGSGHGAGGSPYGQRRMYDFFVRHLLTSP